MPLEEVAPAVISMGDKAKRIEKDEHRRTWEDYNDHSDQCLPNMKKIIPQLATHRHGLCGHSICASVSENEEKRRCHIHWFKRTFSQLSSRLCFGYLYSLLLKMDASVATCYKQVRDKGLTKSQFEATLTSASRRRISDLRLPFLIEPGHRKLSASPTPIMKG